MESVNDRLSRWWSTLSQAARDRLLALKEEDHVPHEFAVALSRAGVFPVSDGLWPERESDPSGFRQPHELRAFLTEQRRA
ncbi:hypothetical protein [Streptomyces sp. RPT161]|uniref:hypothetical protein n=1 Tax=Streptomyces sp. RPT161 TaxID=3015993 RepID=UPI0022B85ACC|nr:hypothetical protein [Streptomyces sp. RPT161]